MNDRESGAEDGAYRLPTPDLSVFGATDDTADADRADHLPPGATEHLGQPTEHAGPPTEPEPADQTDLLGHPAPEAPAHPRGRMSFQDEHTAPRPPTLAEQRARQQARAAAEREEEQRIEANLAAGRRANSRRRVLIGAGVVVGAAAIIGGFYLLSSGGTTTASCVGADPTDQNTVVGDQYCNQAYVTSHGGYVRNDIIFIPIGNGLFRQYRYYYGGTVSNGHISGGSYTAPASGTIKTGTGQTIQRGGFGVSDSGSSGGSSGSKGKSGSGSGSGSGGEEGSSGHSGHSGGS